MDQSLFQNHASVSKYCKRYREVTIVILALGFMSFSCFSKCVFILSFYIYKVWKLAANSLFVVQGSNTWKDLSFKEFQRGTSSGGDVAHVSGTSGKLSGGNRVSSSDDGDSTLFLGQVSQDVDNSESSSGELFELEDSHRSVHDDSLAFGKGFLLLFGGLWSVVKSHPSLGDGIGGDNLGFGILVELVGNNDIGWKKDGLSEFVGLGHNFLGGLNEVVLDKRSSNFVSLGLQEGENHTSTDDDGVALVKKGVKDGDFGGDLGSSNDGGHWLFSVLDGSVKVFEFLGKKESGNGWLKELGDTLGGGVGTVGSSEGIVDVKVEWSGKLFNEFGLVLFFLLVETSVLEHDDISLLSITDDLGDFLSDAVSGKGDFLSKKFAHAFGARSKGELVLWSILRASQVGADGDDGTLSLQVFDGWDGGADTGIISDGLSVKRNVDIATDQNLLSLQFFIGEVLDGLLSIKNDGAVADTESYRTNMSSEPNFFHLQNIHGTQQSSLTGRSESTGGGSSGKESKESLSEVHFVISAFI